MRFTSYGQFKQVVQGYLNVKTEDIISKIPLWTSEVENSLEAVVRHPAAIVFCTYTVRAGYETIPAPSNLNELIFIRAKGNKENLYIEQYETLYSAPLYETGKPTAFCRRGRFYILNEPVGQDTVFEIAYYAAQPYLENDGDVNLWLAQCGSLMLYSVLDKAFSYIPQPEEAAMYKQKASEEFDIIINRLDKEKVAGNTPVLWVQSDRLSKYY